MSMPPASSSKPLIAVPSAAELRLRRHADFQAVYKAARKQYGRELSFFFARRTPFVADPETTTARNVRQASPVSGPRVGLTVGKVLGKAHDRNRIKRRLRAAVRRHAALLGQEPVDVVLHPKRSMLTLEWAAVEADVAQTFRTVRRLADKPQQPPSPRPPRVKKR